MPKLVRLPEAGKLNPVAKEPGSGALSRVQDNVAKAVNQLQPSTKSTPSISAKLPAGASPIAGAVRHSVALPATTWVNIPHKLGKPWTGYQIISQDGQATVKSMRGSPDDKKFIRIQASAAHNCTILVF